MDESYPAPQYTPVEEMLVVKDKAGQDFADYVFQNPDAATRTSELIGHMHQTNPELADVVISLIDGWHLEGVEEPFMDGYHTAYKLISLQAEDVGSRLPIVDTLVVAGYYEGLGELYQDMNDYYNSRYRAMVLPNKVLLDALMDYIQNDERYDDHHARFSFLLGATSLYDVVFQQVALNEQIGEYIESSIEGRPSFIP